MIRYIFFDLGNTLIYKPGVYEEIQKVLAYYNIKVPLEYLILRHKLLSEIIDFPDKTNKDFYINFNKKLIDILGVAVNYSISEEIFTRCDNIEWKAFDDVSILKKIEIPMGIISNWDKTLEEKLKILHPISFDTTIGSQIYGFRKPDSGLFNLALEKTGCKAEEVIFVGDSIFLDYRPAYNSGMKAILIDRFNIYPYFNGNKIRTMNELTNYL